MTHFAMWTKLEPRRCALLALLLMLPAVARCQRTSSDPDPSNELPFGFVDQPANGAAVGRQMQMYGWALDDHGIKEVWIFVDGRFVARTTLTQARTDVTKIYPQYAGGTDVHGWALTVPLTNASPGSHTLLVQAVDTQGATRDIGMVDVSLAR